MAAENLHEFCAATMPRCSNIACTIRLVQFRRLLDLCIPAVSDNGCDAISQALLMSIRQRIAQSLQPYAWTPVGLSDPQERFRVQLSFAGRSFDVTHNNNCASLIPLTLVVGHLPSMFPDRQEAAGLHFHDPKLGRQLGTLRLRKIPSPLSVNPGLTFFGVDTGQHQCLSPPRRALDRWLRRRAHRRSDDPYNFVMNPRAVDQLMIFYICPRPVVLVSVSNHGESNIFPMDLLGPLADMRFSLALRNTSRSVETIKRARRIALSSIRAADKDVAYRLGVHHRTFSINLAELPFTVEPSRNFGLPVPTAPLRTREVEIEDFQVVGSHTFFLGRVVSDVQFSNEPQLFHTSGFHASFQALHGIPFVPA